MARKIITLCDLHLTQEKVEAEVTTPLERSITIGGAEYRVVLCNDCEKQWYQPLVDLIALMGKEVPGQFYTCRAGCGKEYKNKGSRDSHERTVHGSDATIRHLSPPLEKECRFCPFGEFKSASSRSQHMRQMHPEEWEREREREKAE